MRSRIDCHVRPGQMFCASASLYTFCDFHPSFAPGKACILTTNAMSLWSSSAEYGSPGMLSPLRYPKSLGGAVRVSHRSRRPVPTASGLSRYWRSGSAAACGCAAQHSSPKTKPERRIDRAQVLGEITQPRGGLRVGVLWRLVPSRRGGKFSLSKNLLLLARPKTLNRLTLESQDAEA
jgi:hypothetical protein